MNIIIFLTVGVAAGWLAGMLVKGHGLGGFADLVVGAFGAVVGGLIFDIVGINSYGFWESLATSVVGAVLLLFIVGFLSDKPGTKRRIHSSH